MWLTVCYHVMLLKVGGALDVIHTWVEHVSDSRRKWPSDSFYFFIKKITV